MSSFGSGRHLMYLFALKDGRKKLAYGRTPEDALDILALRLTPTEMDQIIRTEFLKINQRDLQKYVDKLG
jgi:hypothetical protein